LIITNSGAENVFGVMVIDIIISCFIV